MNNFWGLNEKEIISKINYRAEIKGGWKENIFYTDVLLGSKKLSKEYIDNSLRKRLEEVELEAEDKKYIFKGDSYFEYAIIYRCNGYNDEYRELLIEVEAMILDRIPKYRIGYKDAHYNDFGLFRTLKRVHSLLILRKFDGIYSLVTRKKGNFYICLQEVDWDICSFDEILYTLQVEGQYFPGGGDLILYVIKLYYGLYLYLIDSENRHEYKSIILNNAQKIIEDWNFSIEHQYIQLLDLSMEFPEIFGDILETPHKIVPADESLLSFNLVKPLTPLSKEEEESIKKMKKTSLKVLMNKPKGIKKQKELIREYVILKHNSPIILEDLKEKIEKAKKDDTLEDRTTLAYLEELKNKIHYEYQIANLEEVNNHLKEYEEIINPLKNEVLVDGMDEDSPRINFIELGYRFVDLALIYSLLGKKDESLKAFEESTIFLKGEILSIEEMEELPRDVEEGCKPLIINLLAHIRAKKLENIDVTSFYTGDLDGVNLNRIGDEEFQELQEQISSSDLYTEFFIGRVEGGTIDVLVKSVDEMIKVEKLLGNSVDYYEKLFNILKLILSLDKAKDREVALEKINKLIDKVYNSISSFEKYIEVYPICEDLRRLVQE